MRGAGRHFRGWGWGAAAKMGMRIFFAPPYAQIEGFVDTASNYIKSGRNDNVVNCVIVSIT
jgi:hypothetical protein